MVTLIKRNSPISVSINRVQLVICELAAFKCWSQSLRILSALRLYWTLSLRLTPRSLAVNSYTDFADAMVPRHVHISKTVDIFGFGHDRLIKERPGKRWCSATIKSKRAEEALLNSCSVVSLELPSVLSQRFHICNFSSLVHPETEKRPIATGLYRTARVRSWWIDISKANW